MRETRSWERTCVAGGCDELVVFEEPPSNGPSSGRQLVFETRCPACGTTQRLLPGDGRLEEHHWAVRPTPPRPFD